MKGIADKVAVDYVLLIKTEEFQVGVKRDGTLEYSGDYTPDAAAKALWEAISGIVAKAEKAAIDNLVATLHPGTKVVDAEVVR